MTRLQNAQKQLKEALLALESAANQKSLTTGSYQTHDPTNVRGDLSALVDEVTIIEAKLSEAIAMIAAINSAEIIDGDPK